MYRLVSTAMTVCAGLWVPAAALAATTIVDTCGQEFSGNGVLAGDLDCTGFAEIAVRIDRTGSLDLAGFTLAGGTAGIFCVRGCTVFSSVDGGTIRDSSGNGVFTHGRKITIENVDILDVGGYGVGGLTSFDPTKVIVLDSTVAGAGVAGVYGEEAKLVRSTLTGNEAGVDVARALRVIDSTISGNASFGAAGGATSPAFEPQIKGAKVLVRRSSITANGEGLRIRGPAIIKDSNIDGNAGAGVVLNRPNEDSLRCLRSTFDGNELDGIFWEATLTASAKLRDCSASNNGRHGIHTDLGEAWLSRFAGSDLAVTGNGGDGIRLQFVERGVSLKRATVTGNGGHGVHATNFGANPSCEVKLTSDTMVAGNGTGVNCGVSETCADVAACANDQPQIDTSSTCETSYVLGSGFPGASWSVCSLD